MDIKLRIKIGKAICERRTYLDMSSEDLAEKINISPRYLETIENGGRGLCLNKTIEICKILSISLDSLLLENNDDSHATKKKYDYFMEEILMDYEARFLMDIAKLIILNKSQERDLILLRKAVKFHIEQIQQVKSW